MSYKIEAAYVSTDERRLMAVASFGPFYAWNLGTALRLRGCVLMEAVCQTVLLGSLPRLNVTAPPALEGNRSRYARTAYPYNRQPDRRVMEAAGRPHFGALLRQFRFDAGITQQELAERAKLSVEAIGVLERGARRRPRRETVALLGRALELSPDREALLAPLGGTPADFTTVIKADLAKWSPIVKTLGLDKP